MVAQRSDDTPHVPLSTDRWLSEAEIFGHLYEVKARGGNGAGQADATDAKSETPTPAGISQISKVIPKRDRTAWVRCAVYQERMEALRAALEGLLIAKGMTVTDAINTVTRWVRTSKGRTSAKAVAALWGYDYKSMAWG